MGKTSAATNLLKRAKEVLLKPNALVKNWQHTFETFSGNNIEPRLLVPRPAAGTYRVCISGALIQAATEIVGRDGLYYHHPAWRAANERITKAEHRVGRNDFTKHHTRAQVEKVLDYAIKQARASSC